MQPIHLPSFYRLLCFLSIALFFGVTLTGCDRQAEQTAARLEPITVAVAAWTGSAPLFIAEDQGYFREEGLDATLQVNVSGHLGLDDVHEGKADLATAGETPIARAILNGRPLALIATIAKIDRPILIIARKDKGIFAADDLKGRKIGVTVGTTADFFLNIFLATRYIRRPDVQIIDIAADSAVEMLRNGAVDAVSTWAPHTLVLQDDLGGNAAVFYDTSIYTMTWNVAAAPAAVRNHPERFRKFLRAIRRADRFIRESPAQARDIVARRLGTQSSLFEREWPDYAFVVELDQSLLLNLEDQARWMTADNAGSETVLPNFLDHVHAEALQAVDPEAVRIAGK